MINEVFIFFVKRIVIVFDYSLKFLLFFKQYIDFDGGGKKGKGKGFSVFFFVFKSFWICSIEVVVEYCRIVYDIFLNEYLVSEWKCCLFIGWFLIFRVIVN